MSNGDPGDLSEDQWQEILQRLREQSGDVVGRRNLPAASKTDFADAAIATFLKRRLDPKKHPDDANAITVEAIQARLGQHVLRKARNALTAMYRDRKRLVRQSDRESEEAWNQVIADPSASSAIEPTFDELFAELNKHGKVQDPELIRVAQCCYEGYQPREIAERLGLSTHQVRRRIALLHSKLDKPDF